MLPCPNTYHTASHNATENRFIPGINISFISRTPSLKKPIKTKLYALTIKIVIANQFIQKLERTFTNNSSCNNTGNQKVLFKKVNIVNYLCDYKEYGKKNL